MLNEERVREMTQMAIFEKNDGHKCKPMMQYFRKDYIEKEMLKSFISGTIAFCLMGVIWVMYKAEELMNSLQAIDIKNTITTVVLLYVIFMAVYFLATYLIYNHRYTKGRQKVKHYYTQLKKVNRIYRQEEQL